MSQVLSVAAPPLSLALIPLAIAIGEVVKASRHARGNKVEAEMLAQRVQDCGAKMTEVVAAVKEQPHQAKAVTTSVERLTQVMKECTNFLEAFGKKGFLGRMMSGKIDVATFKRLDDRLAHHSAEIGDAVALQSLQMQTRMFEKMEQLSQLISANEKDGTKVASLCSGLSGEELQSELGAISEQLSALSSGQDEIKNMLSVKAQTEQGFALARQDKERAIAKYEVDVESIQEPHFAEGTFGKVHRAELDGHDVCLKKMPLAGMSMPQRMKIFKDYANELAIMVQMRSPRIILVYGVVTKDPTYLGFVVEYCVNGDLRRELDNNTNIDPGQKQTWISDIAIGMRYLYKMNIQHRDLKTMNVLLDEKKRAKISDFGMSKSDDLATHAASGTVGGIGGTPAYMAPELLEDNIFTEKSDVYSYAIVCWEVLTQGRPFPGLKPSQISVQVLIKQARPPVPENLPDMLMPIVGIMKRCWAHEATERPTFLDITNLLKNPESPAKT